MQAELAMVYSGGLRFGLFSILCAQVATGVDVALLGKRRSLIGLRIYLVLKAVLLSVGIVEAEKKAEELRCRLSLAVGEVR